mgnify:CR=1 FL=1
MKNILDKKFYVMLLGLLFFAPACTDLDEELFSDVTDENFFQSDDEFISALGGAYSSFYGIGNHSNLWSSNEISSKPTFIIIPFAIACKVLIAIKGMSLA